jgi:hypothetical protein
MLGTHGRPVSRMTVLIILVHSGNGWQDYLQRPMTEPAYTLWEHLRALGATIET